MNLERKVSHSQEVKKESMWWVNNLKPSNGTFLVNKKTQIVIASNVSLKGWEESSVRVKKERGPGQNWKQKSR